MPAQGGGWLDRLREPDRQALTAAGRRRSLSAGETLLHQGAISGRVFVVLSGQVRVTTTTPEGRETTLATVGPGEVVGELSAVDGLPHSGTATAVGPVEALLLSAADFRRVLSEHGSLALAVLEEVGRRLRQGDRARVEFGAGAVLGRVAALLVAFGSVGAGEGGAVTLSQEEMATWLGTSREAVNRALRRLAALGVVEVARRRVEVLDQARLQRLARR